MGAIGAVLAPLPVEDVLDNVPVVALTAGAADGVVAPQPVNGIAAITRNAAPSRAGACGRMMVAAFRANR
jgi:hypothetical protein